MSTTYDDLVDGRGRLAVDRLPTRLVEWLESVAGGRDAEPLDEPSGRWGTTARTSPEAER